MDFLPGIIMIAIVAFIVLIPNRRLGGKSFYWFVFSRHQWSLMEFLATLIVGTLPVGFTARSLPKDMQWAVGLILTVGLVFSFTGAAIGLMIAKHFKIDRPLKRFGCIVLGWIVFYGVLFCALFNELSKYNLF